MRLCSVTIKGRVIKEEQILPNGGKADRIAIEHEYDQWGGHTGPRSSLGAEQNTSYTPLGKTETLHARQSEESDAWESRIRYDERGREIERFTTGGVRITSEYDFAGRLEARCTYTGTESRGHRFYAWRRNDRLLSMRSHLRKSPKLYPSGWRWSSRARIKTYKITTLAKGIGRKVFFFGVLVDGIGLANGSISPQKALLNTGISAVTTFGGPIGLTIGLIYWGLDSLGAFDRGYGPGIETNREIAPIDNLRVVRPSLIIHER